MRHQKTFIFLNLLEFSVTMLLIVVLNKKMRDLLNTTLFISFSLTLSCGKGFFKKVDARGVRSLALKEQKM